MERSLVLYWLVGKLAGWKTHHPINTPVIIVSCIRCLTTKREKTNKGPFKSDVTGLRGRGGGRLCSFPNDNNGGGDNAREQVPLSSDRAELERIIREIVTDIRNQ